MNRRAVAKAVEHLKSVVSDVILAYKEGIAADPAEAIARLQAEIQGALQDIKPSAYRDIAQFRITVLHNPEDVKRAMQILDDYGEVVSTRYVGPRGSTDSAVMYVAAALTVPRVPMVLAKFKDKGFEVRDWNYGCVRRAAV